MDIQNELVWSHSRARAFGACPRAYWFTYYGSWGGWDSEAPVEAKNAYIQKKLTTRAMWTGTVVHAAAEEALKRVRAGLWVDVDAGVDTTFRRARVDIADSKSGAWLQRPSRRTGFREHYYDEPLAEDAWDKAIAEIERQVRGLYANRIFRRLLQVSDRIIEVEELQRFPVGDAEVYVSLDALVSDGNGGVVIIDWKTGDAHSDTVIAAQLGIYGLYATERLGVPIDKVKAMHVNLRHATDTLHPIGPHAIAAAREEVAVSVGQMRGKLRDITQNLADPADHPVLPEGDPSCRWCSFRRSCGRE